MTHEPPDRPKLLKPDLVAKTLDCNIKTVYRMLDAGRLTGLYLMGPPQAQRRGKKGIRIFAESVDALLAAGPTEIAEFQQYLRLKGAGSATPPPRHQTTRPSKPTGRAWEMLPPPS